MQGEIDKYRMLLLEAARLYEKHEAGRREPFNVFTVLRAAHDEVNLHSRFLHALLDYRISPQSPKENLRDFLESVFSEDDVPDISPDIALVERERDNVDILVRDPSSNQAVVIENKIQAIDQPGQLQKYDKQLKHRGYTSRLIYLSLDGHEPEEHSHGNLDVDCISYRDNLPDWLERCQKRAFDEPALRESIHQYRRLIAKMTGSDQGEAYMNELGGLLHDDNNLVLAFDLNKAITKVRVELLTKLWNEIRDGLKLEVKDLPSVADYSDISEERIRRFVTCSRNYKWHGLFFPFREGVELGVEVDHQIYFGVRCFKEKNPDEHIRLKENLDGLDGGDTNVNWPWVCYPPSNRNPNLRHPNRDDLEMLANEQGRKKYVDDVVSGVRTLWNYIKEKQLNG